MKRNHGKSERRILSLLVILVLAGALTGGAVFLSGQAPLPPSGKVEALDTGRSDGIVTGSGYSVRDRTAARTAESGTAKVKSRTVRAARKSAAWEKAAPKADGSGGRGDSGKPSDHSDSDSTEKRNENVPDSKETGPKIITSISDGEVIRGNVLNFSVQGKDENGYSLTKTHWTVLLNGVRMVSTGDNYKGLYTRRIGDTSPALNDGKNTVSITLQTDSGKTASVTMTIRMDSLGSAAAAGTMTIRTTASAVGLGTVVPGRKVKIYSGEKLSDVVRRYFEESGVSYTMKNGYLSRIRISTSGISSDIRKEYDPPSDSLGEKDIGPSSGWKYELNGTRNLSGLSSVEAEDGDDMEIYYTVDIDG